MNMVEIFYKYFCAITCMMFKYKKVKMKSQILLTYFYTDILKVWKVGVIGQRLHTSWILHQLYKKKKSVKLVWQLSTYSFNRVTDIFIVFSFSESYFTVKGAAVILPQSDETAYTRKVPSTHAGNIYPLSSRRFLQVPN